MRLWLPWVLAGSLAVSVAGTPGPQVDVIQIRGAISPATSSYIGRAVREAAADGAQCLVIELDTPGGLLESTKEIVQSIYAAPVPVVVFVTPAGASAGSAGCFITLAADIAAMSPNTSIGAAHPVALGGMGGDNKPDEVMTKKMENYAVSFIESIASRRNRNVEWARSAVRDSASITAEKALELRVIEIIARDTPELLRKLDGLEAGGRQLRTADARAVPIPMLARERVFHLLWRPEVMFVLLLITIYGIVGELSTPGAILPGVAGSIALVLLLYMASVLPVNIAGLALIALAVLLLIADVFASTHGVLTAGGIISFLVGSLMLFDRAATGFSLSLGLVLPATLVTAAFFVWVIGSGLRAQLRPVRTGRESMVGTIGTAESEVDARAGRVFVEGEHWQARSEMPIPPGQPVEITGLHGLTLHVKPKT